MSEELTFDAFQRSNQENPDWYIFIAAVPPRLQPLSSARKLPEYNWCRINVEDEWFTVARDDQKCLFYLRSVSDAIAFRIRKKGLEYLGHDRFSAALPLKLAVNG